MSYIKTYTGKHFDPIDPDMSMIDILDIAHALSFICRGTGQVKSFFSVGQHCINAAKEAAARGYSQRVILACLIHDASEAYMSDVPRPFKHTLPKYMLLEDKLLNLIYEKFLGSPLTEEEYALVKSVDNDLLYYDLKVLLNEIGDAPEPLLHIALNYNFVPFEQIEKNFLKLYDQYKIL